MPQRPRAGANRSAPGSRRGGETESGRCRGREDQVPDDGSFTVRFAE